MKGAESLGNGNINDLCIHPVLKFPPKFKCPKFKKDDGKRCPYTDLKLYGAIMGLI